MNRLLIFAAGLVCAVGVSVAALQAPASLQVDNKNYEKCESYPTTDCLIDLALMALPSDHQFPDWHGAEAFSDAGLLAFVESRRTPDGRFDGLGYATSKVVARVQASPEAFAAAQLPAGAFLYIAARWLLQDHRAYGGGYGPIVEAEKVAFERRFPLPSSPAIEALLSRWRAELSQKPDPRQLLEYATILFWLGRPHESRSAAIAAPQPMICTLLMLRSLCSTEQSRYWNPLIRSIALLSWCRALRK